MPQLICFVVLLAHDRRLLIQFYSKEQIFVTFFLLFYLLLNYFLGFSSAKEIEEILFGKTNSSLYLSMIY